MSDLPSEELDVPIERVDRSRRGRRRALIATVAVVGVVGAGIGLAGMDRPADSAAVAATAGETTPPAGASPMPEGVPARRQDLPVVENVPLPNGPQPALIVRSGTDAKLVAWTPGEPEVRHVRTFPDAYNAAARNQRVSLSPGGRFAVSLIGGRSGAAGADRVRLITEDGISWDRDGVTADVGVVWWGGSERLALIGRASSMILGEVDTAGRVAEREVGMGGTPLGGHASPPTGGPRADPGPDDLFAPIGFSVDGGSVVAARFNEATRTIEPAFRVDFAAGLARPLDAFPTAGPDALSAQSQEFGFVDPVRGRALQFRDFSEVEAPPINVLEPDGQVAFTVEGGWPAGLWWDDEGRLVILDRDVVDGPAEFRLRSVDADGNTSLLFETPPLRRASLIGVKDGYAGLALVMDPPRRTQVVLVAMDGSTVSGVEIGPLDYGGPDGAGWLP